MAGLIVFIVFTGLSDSVSQFHDNYDIYLSSMAIAAKARHGIMGAVASAVRAIRELYHFVEPDSILPPGIHTHAHDLLECLLNPAYLTNASTAGLFQGHFSSQVFREKLEEFVPALAGYTALHLRESAIVAGPSSLPSVHSVELDQEPDSPEPPAFKRQRSGNFPGPSEASGSSSLQVPVPLFDGSSLATPVTRQGAGVASGSRGSSVSAASQSASQTKRKRQDGNE